LIVHAIDNRPIVNDKFPVSDDSQNRETQAIKQAPDPKSTGVFKSTGIK
jgi:hypothetical protein